MKVACRRAIILFAGLLIVSACSRSSDDSGAKEVIPWRSDLATARAESLRTHKPVFVEFGATWCGPCQKMAQTAFVDPRVAAALAESVPVRIDVDQHSDLARQYGIDSIPALLILDEKGNVVKSEAGYMSSGQLIAWLQSKQENDIALPSDKPSPLLTQ